MIINLTGNYPRGDNIWKKETIFLSESFERFNCNLKLYQSQITHTIAPNVGFSYQ